MMLCTGRFEKGPMQELSETRQCGSLRGFGMTWSVA